MSTTWSILGIWKTLQGHQWYNNNFQDMTRCNEYIRVNLCIQWLKTQCAFFPAHQVYLARRGENIHNAGLNVRVVWDAPNRVDEQTNQESAPFNSHPRHFLLTIRHYCFVVKSRLLVSHRRAQDLSVYFLN